MLDLVLIGIAFIFFSTLEKFNKMYRYMFFTIGFFLLALNFIYEEANYPGISALSSAFFIFMFIILIFEVISHLRIRKE